MDMTQEQEDAAKVAAALRAYEARIIDLADRVRAGNMENSSERKHCQDLLAVLKQDARDALKRGKVEDDYLPQTACERMYFVNAMRDAATRITAKPNSHLITSQWEKCLSAVRRDISYQVGRIREQFPDI